MMIDTNYTYSLLLAHTQFLFHAYRNVSLARMQCYTQRAYLFYQCGTSLLSRDGRIADRNVRHPGVERPFSSYSLALFTQLNDACQLQVLIFVHSPECLYAPFPCYFDLFRYFNSSYNFYDLLRFLTQMTDHPSSELANRTRGVLSFESNVIFTLKERDY